MKPWQHTRQKYWIGEADYFRMLEAQWYRCPICCKHQADVRDAFVVDHNHTTEEVRGLLCFGCNSGYLPLVEFNRGAKRGLKYDRAKEYLSRPPYEPLSFTPRPKRVKLGWVILTARATFDPGVLADLAEPAWLLA